MFKTPFKPIGHYVFNYKPRYYDERKERIQALEDRYQRENSENTDITLSKNNLKNEWIRAKTSYSNDHNYTFRLLLIIALLCLITWSLFNFDKIISAKQGFSKVIEALWMSISKAKQ